MEAAHTYREMARRIRQQAAEIKYLEVRKMLESIAAGYDRLAGFAAARQEHEGVEPGHPG